MEKGKVSNYMGFYASIQCDKCGKTNTYSHIGKTHIARWSRNDGWSVKKDITYCPKCRKRKRGKS